MKFEYLKNMDKKKLIKISITIILIILIIVGLCLGGYYVYKNIGKKEEVKEIKVINKIDKYGYQLKENKTSKYKNLFEELKEILNEENVNEENYVKKISEMFIYDFYSLSDKTAKTDIGGTDFVYNEILENFLQNAQDTYYKYVESNVYNNRKQSLPTVSNITIDKVENTKFEYNNKYDDKAYEVDISWDYTDNQFSSYQKKATLVFIHDGDKLSLVELQ